MLPFLATGIVSAPRPVRFDPDMLEVLEGYAARHLLGLAEPGEEPLDLVHQFIVERGERMDAGDYLVPQWCAALRNWAVSRHRRRRPEALGEREPVEPMPQVADPGEVDPLAPRIPHEAGLGLMRSLAGRPQGVDYGAVLLLSERVLAARHARVTIDPSHGTAERVYPWNACDDQRTIRRPLACNGALWNHASRMAQPSWVGLLSDQQMSVAVATQWLHRARQQLLQARPEAGRAFPHWQEARR